MGQFKKHFYKMNVGHAFANKKMCSKGDIIFGSKFDCIVGQII
jgi:hypothetical protein